MCLVLYQTVVCLVIDQTTMCLSWGRTAHLSNYHFRDHVCQTATSQSPLHAAVLGSISRSTELPQAMARPLSTGDIIEISESDNESVPPALSFSVDFMEVFSPMRIAPECLKLGLTAGPSVDEHTGLDLSCDSDRARVLALVYQLKPKVLMTCAPCGMFSSLNRMWNFKKWSPQKRMPR